ncbi:MAG: hypothetical protein PHH08_00680 [Candidatus ainarchaeum sp.]|nr:hypothetical protein [Candidatus ainarchaeum sp.]
MISEELFDFPVPSREEIRFAIKTAKVNPDDLDSRQAWILQKFTKGFFE